MSESKYEGSDRLDGTVPDPSVEPIGDLREQGIEADERCAVEGVEVERVTQHGENWGREFAEGVWSLGANNRTAAVEVPAEPEPEEHDERGDQHDRKDAAFSERPEIEGQRRVVEE